MSPVHLPQRLGPFFQNFDTETAFAFYEQVRQRLPDAHFPETARHISGLLEIANDFDTFVFDAFGVLNVGDTPIAGAVKTIESLRAQNKQVFVATNAASYSRQQSVVKFQRMGFDFSEFEIVTSRMAAEQALSRHALDLWGVIASNAFAKSDLNFPSLRLTDQPEAYDCVDGFLFLSTQEWSADQQLMLERSLSKNQRQLIIANPDVIAPREVGFSTEPGYCGHRIAELIGSPVEFHGKPFGSIFELVGEQHRGAQDLGRVCMVGDTLHTDVLGGAAQGWSTVLISDHGLFKGHNVNDFISRSGIVPSFIAPNI